MTTPTTAALYEARHETQIKYRKKTAVIEAFQMTQARRMNNSEWPEWLNEAWNKNKGEAGSMFRKNVDAEMPDLLCIWTWEGVYLVDWGDWIICGVNGELYHCKPDTFAATYEPVLANAKLADAAPAMADALERIVRRLQLDVDDGSRPDQWTMEDLMRTAKAALPAGGACR